jgi:site-specific DNA recombinase
VRVQDLQYFARQQPRPVEGIIFWSFSRLARRQIDSQFIKSDLRRQGYVLHSMTDDVPTGDIAPVVEAIIDWKNERYLSDLSRDVKRGLYDLARAGYAPGGCPPRGYKAMKVQIGVKRDGEPHLVSQWAPDPELAPKVRQAFEMRAAGASYEEILEATRLFPVRGSYVTMFRNKSYLGIRKCGELEVEDAHEPLVDRQTWDAVQSTLGRRGGSSDPGQVRQRRETHPFLLTGLARCAECGAAMVGKEDRSGARKTPFRHYICGRKNREGWKSCPSGKIPAEGPEQAVLKFVAESVLTPELVREQAALMDLPARRRDRPLRERIEDAQYRLAGVEKSIAVLLDLAEQYGAASAGVRLVEREAERSEVMAELEELEARQDTEEPIAAQDTVQTMLAEMQETLAGADTKAKQALLRRLAVRVTLGKEQGEVIYTSPSGSLRTLIRYPRGGVAQKTAQWSSVRLQSNSSLRVHSSTTCSVRQIRSHGAFRTRRHLAPDLFPLATAAPSLAAERFPSLPKHFPVLPPSWWTGS